MVIDDERRSRVQTKRGEAIAMVAIRDEIFASFGQEERLDETLAILNGSEADAYVRVVIGEYPADERVDASLQYRTSIPELRLEMIHGIERFKAMSPEEKQEFITENATKYEIKE